MKLRFNGDRWVRDEIQHFVEGMNEVMSTRRVVFDDVCTSIKRFCCWTRRAPHMTFETRMGGSDCVAGIKRLHIRVHPELYVPTFNAPCARFMVFSLRAFGI
jgi:hypothetical protein